MSWGHSFRERERFSLCLPSKVSPEAAYVPECFWPKVGDQAAMYCSCVLTPLSNIMLQRSGTWRQEGQILKRLISPIPSPLKTFCLHQCVYVDLAKQQDSPQIMYDYWNGRTERAGVMGTGEEEQVTIKT